MTQVTTCDCNFLAEDVIKKTAGNNWSQARTTRERKMDKITSRFEHAEAAKRRQLRLVVGFFVRSWWVPA